MCVGSHLTRCRRRRRRVAAAAAAARRRAPTTAASTATLSRRWLRSGSIPASCCVHVVRGQPRLLPTVAGRERSSSVAFRTSSATMGTSARSATGAPKQRRSRPTCSFRLRARFAPSYSTTTSATTPSPAPTTPARSRLRRGRRRRDARGCALSDCGTRAVQYKAGARSASVPPPPSPPPPPPSPSPGLPPTALDRPPPPPPPSRRRRRRRPWRPMPAPPSTRSSL